MLARILPAVPLLAVAGGEPGVNATVVPSTAAEPPQVNLLPATPPQAHSWEDDLCEAISMHREVSKRKTLVSLPKAPMTATSSPFVQTTPRDVLTERLGLDSRVTTFGHIQRGGRSCALDRIPDTEAVKALLEATPDIPSYTINVRENKITRVPLIEAVEMTRQSQMPSRQGLCKGNVSA
ncbi:hypothetical protein EDD17DRAFT_1749682 [Pisolithus thermaeus]|nr:hypothetical protein EDD17DRAFT_1749682 [Pisolithus thermaeus]